MKLHNQYNYHNLPSVRLRERPNIEDPQHYEKLKSVIADNLELFITRGGERIRNFSLNHPYNNSIVRSVLNFDFVFDQLLPIAAKFEIEIYLLELEWVQSGHTGVGDNNKHRQIIAIERKRRENLKFQLHFIFNRLKNKIRKERLRIKKLNEKLAEEQDNQTVVTESN